MKNILLSAILFAAIVSCSSPKYAYFNSPSTESAGSTNAREGSLDRRWNKVELTTLNSSSSIQGETLAAGTSIGKIVHDYKKTSNQELTKPGKEFGTAGKEVKTMEKTSVEPVKVGDKSKNGFAVAGFISGFIPLLSLVVPLYPLNAVLLVGGFISAVVCSIIGMKSEKRGLAWAGFIIGVISTVVVLIVVAIALSGI